MQPIEKSYLIMELTVLQLFLKKKLIVASCCLKHFSKSWAKYAQIQKGYQLNKSIVQIHPKDNVGKHHTGLDS